MISLPRVIWNVRSNVDGRMLKKATFTSAYPMRYYTHPPQAYQDRLLTPRTRLFPNFVLGVRRSLTYRWEEAGHDRLRAAWVEWRYASGALFACDLALGRSGSWPTWGGWV